jgi:hypothetical protein
VDAEAAKIAAELRAKWSEWQRAMIHMLDRIDANNAAVRTVNEKLGPHDDLGAGNNKPAPIVR